MEKIEQNIFTGIQKDKFQQVSASDYRFNEENTNKHHCAGTFHNRQISEKRCFEKYCSCNKVCQFSALYGTPWRSYLENLTTDEKSINKPVFSTLYTSNVYKTCVGTSTGVEPSNIATSTGVEPSNVATSAGVEPSNVATSTGVEPSNVATSTGVEPSNVVTPTGGQFGQMVECSFKN